MAEFHEDTYSKLVEGLKKRLAAAMEYLKLTRRQKAELEAENVEAFNKSLAERGKLIERIDAMNSALAGPLKLYQGYKAKAPEGDAAVIEVEGIVEKTKEALKISGELDDGNARAVNSLMREAAGERKKLSKSRKGIGKYAQKDMQFSPGFIDARQ